MTGSERPFVPPSLLEGGQNGAGQGIVVSGRVLLQKETEGEPSDADHFFRPCGRGPSWGQLPLHRFLHARLKELLLPQGSTIAFTSRIKKPSSHKRFRVAGLCHK